jgi:hypothetical protein
MIKYLFLFFFILVMPLSFLYAQSSDADSAFSTIDSENAAAPIEEDQSVEEDPPLDTILNIHQIIISSDTISSWKDKKEFSYVSNLDSLLKLSQEMAEAEKLKKSSSSDNSFLDYILNATVIKLFLWSLAIFFVGIIAFQLFTNRGMFSKVDAKSAQEPEMQELEDVLGMDMDQLVYQACLKADYRLAIRYLFLKTLKLLRDKDIIEFSVDKTNGRYINEIPSQWRNDFAVLIHNYEYVWYGHFNLSEAQFALLQKKYSSFNDKI